MKPRIRKKLVIVCKYTLMIFVTVILTFPIMWLFLGSIKPSDELFQTPPTFLPQQLSLASYAFVFQHTDLLRNLFNSLVVAFGSTFLTILITIHGGYSMARLRFPGQRVLSKFILCFYMFPPILLVFPIYMILKKLHLIDTIWGLMLIHTILNIPFCLWMLRAFFLGIPKELEDAGAIDGCSRLGTFYRIILPLSMPGVAAVGLFAFIVSWSEFLMAITTISSTDNQTLPIMIGLQIGGFTIDWTRLLTLSVIIIVPVFFIGLIFSKYLVEGLTAGAVKY